jgi:hypothetical protein
MALEHWIWPAFAVGIAVIFYLSEDGFYRYHCQDPENWAALECQPPICLRTKNCADDLTGGVAP